MRLGSFAALAGIAVSVAALSADASSLVALVNAAEYFGTTYTAQPSPLGTAYVFFTGEPIRLRLEVVNWGKSDEALLTTTTAANAFVSKMYRNENPFDAAVTVGSGLLKRAGELEFPVNLERRMPLSPREVLHWEATVDRDLPPGSYVIDITAVGTDERLQPVLPSRFRFEVRARSAEARVELLRRDALRQYLKGDYAEAESIIATLLQEHPTSFEAYVIRGDIAKAQGKGAAASRDYERALALVTAGADTRYVGRTNPVQVQHTVEGLRAKVTLSQR